MTIIFYISFFHPHQVNSHFIERKAEGWHWYETLRVDEIKDPEKEQKPKSPSDPITQLNIFKKTVERLKAIAVMDPTYQNVKAYMEIQKVLMDRSTRFAERWMEVVYTSPLLDYTLKHPTSQAARHVYLDLQHREIRSEIGRLSRTYGLFFFYRGDCIYSREFAAIVKAFSQRYKWEVLPVSLDGTILPEFPESRMDNGASAALGVTSVPTLLAVEPQSGKVIPLSRGMSTHDQIEDRIRVLILKRRGL